jgi:predicted nucleotidyltransferase
MLRGESMLMNSVLGAEARVSFNLNSIQGFEMFEATMKPRGNALTRLFSSSFSPKDIFIFPEGEIKITEKVRDNNHAF